MTLRSLSVPIPISPVLIAWGLPAELAHQLSVAIQRRAELVTAGGRLGVQEALTRTPDACLVVHVPSTASAVFWGELQLLRAEFPHVPAVAVAQATVSTLQGAWRLGRTDISELLCADPALDPDDTLAALARAHADGVIGQLWRRVTIPLPDPFVTVLRRALRLAHQPFSAADLAQVSRMHPRSLRKYCERHQLPHPQQIVGWARLLLSAHYLDEPGRSLNDVAELLRYQSPCALRKMVTRYVGLSTSQLRQQGALPVIVKGIRDDLARAGVTAASNSEVHVRPTLTLVRGTDSRPSARPRPAVS